MADNVAVTEGSGKNIATDDIQVDGSHTQGQVQFVKLVDGTLNGTGSVRVNQAAKANALTVAPASDISDATYIGDIKFGEAVYTEDVATPATIIGLATVMERDDALGSLTPAEGDWASLRCDANGALWTHDDALDAALSGTELQVDIVASLPAGTNAIGKLAANSGVDIGDVTLTAGTAAIGKLAANSGVDIGDVDVTSIVPGVAATNLGKAEDAGHSSGDVGVAAMTVRANTATSLSGSDNDYQPLITDTNGRLHVLDANSANILTALQILDDWDDSDYCNVNINIAGTDCDGGSGAQGAQTLRVILATDDPAVALLTTIDSDTNNIKTAVEIIDDWDAVHDSAASSDGPQVMAAYDSTKPAVVEDGDAVRMLADQYGRLLAGVEPQHFQAIFDSANASAEGNAIHASAASTIIVVQSYIISSDAEIWVKLQEEDSTALTGKFWLKAGGGVAITLPDKAPIVLGVDSDLEVITEGAGNVSVSVTGYTIPG